jgi:hypothetical protein
VRPVLTLVLLLLLASCNGPNPPAATPAPSPSPSPAPSPVQLRSPADAILADGETGLPRVRGRDHLSAAEAASLEANQPEAFQRFAAWGWVEESTRSWAAGGRRADAFVLSTLRPDGAHRAYEYYVQRAVVAPYTGGSCPPGVTGLDECFSGSAPGSGIVTGRLGDELFVVEGAGVDVFGLAALQAQRLRA